MIITTKEEINHEGTKVPKGSRGSVVGNQWGEKGERYIVEFETIKEPCFVPRHKAAIMEENNAYKESFPEKKKRKSGKQEREEELFASTFGKGSNEV